MHPKERQWTRKSVDEWVSKAVKKVEDSQQSELKKLLPIADPELTSAFLEEIKIHNKKFSTPKMLKEKLYNFAISAMPTPMKIKWLQRWNMSEKMRESHRFPKKNFSDLVFSTWLQRATWWAQVCFKFLFNITLLFKK